MWFYNLLDPTFKGILDYLKVNCGSYIYNEFVVLFSLLFCIHKEKIVNKRSWIFLTRALVLLRFRHQIFFISFSFELNMCIIIQIDTTHKTLLLWGSCLVIDTSICFRRCFIKPLMCTNSTTPPQQPFVSMFNMERGLRQKCYTKSVKHDN